MNLSEFGRSPTVQLPKCGQEKWPSRTSLGQHELTLPIFWHLSFFRIKELLLSFYFTNYKGTSLTVFLSFFFFKGPFLERGSEVKSLSHVRLCNPMDCNLPGSSVHGIFQARVLEWGAISFSRGSSLTQGLIPGSLHCSQTLYHLSHQGSAIGNRKEYYKKQRR